MIPVIICGGFGTKLWPVSREHRPKHFLRLLGDKSLFQLNYEALRTKFKPEEIFISTNTGQVDLAQQQASEIPIANFIIEPEMKNQGPATGLIAAHLTKLGMENEPFMLVQVDDLREPVESFIKTMEECDKIARSTNKYITGGFKPNYPVMGVDYLVKGNKINENDISIYSVSKFVWRSSKEETEKLITEPNLLVHTNHTCMTSKNFLEMLKKYKLEWYEPLQNYINGGDLNTEFAKMPAGPLEDVTQKVHEAGESLVVELPFKWTDFGTFESIDKYLKDNNMYNVGDNIVDLNGKNNYLRLDDPNKIVALVGVDNLVIVDTGDVLLISDKKSTGQIGEALKEVKNRKLALT
ncbi:MAG: ManC [uncultured bacterium]|nr:MAG: ManC [uncultured bacterium]